MKMMEKRRLYSPLLGVLLSMVSTNARADFIFELTNGRQVTVGQYVDEGQTFKVYTSTGTIGFHKTDVKQITEVGASQGTNVPLESVTSRPPAATQAVVSDPSEEKEMPQASDGAGAASGEEGASKAEHPQATVERLDEQYQETAFQQDALWDNYLRDVKAGASEETLSANLQQLQELDQERLKLIKSARGAASDNLPAWAQ